jgi:hypothetical protein
LVDFLEVMFLIIISDETEKIQHERKQEKIHLIFTSKY